MRRPTGLSLATLSLLAFGVAACASDPGSPRGGLGAPDGSPPLGLFVSPFGELFEGQPGGPWPVTDWFTAADADANGQVTLPEFSADGARVFASLDLRQDGRLTPDEVAVYEQGLAQARARLPGIGGTPRGPGRRLEGFSGGLTVGEPSSREAEPQEGGPPRSRGGDLPTGPLAYGPIAAAGFFNSPEPVKAADTDTNQTVTAEEWARATERWFGLLDTDHDGVLTLATLPVTPLQQVMERRR